MERIQKNKISCEKNLLREAKKDDFFKKKKTLSPLFMDAVQLPQG